MFGGICGLGNVTIRGSFNDGEISGTERVGGVIGDDFFQNKWVDSVQSIVVESYNSGSVTGYDSVGGVIGQQRGKILQCYNSGDVTGTGGDQVAGITGLCYGYISSSTPLEILPLIENCYNIGTISSSGTQVGGITGGVHRGSVRACYNAGSISSDNISNVGTICGFLSVLDSEISTSYSLENLVNGSSGVELEGVTFITAENLRTLAPVLGEAFKSNTDSNVNNGYPLLKWQ